MTKFDTCESWCTRDHEDGTEQCWSEGAILANRGERPTFQPEGAVFPAILIHALKSVGMDNARVVITQKVLGEYERILRLLPRDALEVAHHVMHQGIAITFEAPLSVVDRNILTHIRDAAQARLDVDDADKAVR